MNPFHKTIIPRNLLLLIEKTSLYTNFAQICSNMSLPRKDLEREIFLASELSFEALALEVFRFQHQNNPVYRQFCDALHIVASELDAITQIPFLPIQFFKSRDIKTTLFEPETIFESSGTTGSINSKHLVKDLSIYEQSFNSTLRLFYGHHPSRCIILSAVSAALSPFMSTFMAASKYDLRSCSGLCIALGGSRRHMVFRRPST